MNRLVSKQDFKFVFDKPRKISCQHLKILYRSNALPQPRLGIIVPKKVMQLAVDRNRTRRIIRESFRHHQASIAAYDIIVMVVRVVKRAESKVLREEADGAWRMDCFTSQKARGSQ